MDMQELEFTVDADGKVTIQVKGAKGSQCLEISKPFEEALGEVEKRTHTPEFYEKATDKQQTNVKPKS
ncbi:MAG TPA: DUF2997 domain-containing protein [Negativicutes bacterium]|jgi:hypothetical protein